MELGESNAGAEQTLISGPTPVTDAVGVARAFAVERGIEGNDLSRLCVIVEEVFANIYEHGGVGPDESVEMILSTSANGVRVVIVDPGRPFDPRDASLGRPPPERGGGAGIEIMRQWASEIDYADEDGTNRLELLIPLRDGGHDRFAI